MARSAGCEEVVLRLVRSPGTAWLDLRGAVSPRIPLGAANGAPGADR